MLVLRAALFMPLLHVRGGADGTENMATGFNTVTTRPRGRGRYGRGGWERQAGFALLRRAMSASRCCAAPRDVGREGGDEKFAVARCEREMI